MAEPMDAAVAAMEADNEIAQKLGTPIERHMGFEIDSNSKNGNGSATMTFDAGGPKESANVSGKMKQIAGKWSPEDLRIKCSDGTEFRLPRKDDE